MSTKARKQVFEAMLALFFVASLFVIFIVLTRMCVLLSASTLFQSKTLLFQGSSYVQPQTEDQNKEVSFSLQNLVQKIAKKYVDLIVPEIRYLPKKISHPLIQTGIPSKPDAYTKPVGTYVVHPAMSLTYIHYAPAPGAVENVYHNIQQFRYPENLGKKAPNEIRIFITGGSTAWGCLSPDLHTTIAGLLEKRFNSTDLGQFRVRVINAAAGGWHTTDERFWILNRITDYEPDLVISYSGFNDIFNVYQHRQDLFSNLHNESSYYYWALREYEAYNRGQAAVDLLQDFGSLWYRDVDFPWKTVKNIQIISAYLQALGCKYMFVLQPVHFAYPEVNRLASAFDIMAQVLDNAQQKIPFKFLNHLKLFDGREQFFIDVCHFGDKGNQIIADDLFRELQPMISDIIAQRPSALGVQK